MKFNAPNSTLVLLLTLCAVQGQNATKSNQDAVISANYAQTPNAATNPTGSKTDSGKPTNPVATLTAPEPRDGSTNKLLKKTNELAQIKTPPTPADSSAQPVTPILVKMDQTTLAALQPQPQVWWKNLLPLFSTLIGAVIALFGGYWATTRSHELQVERQKRQDADFVKRLEACLATELDMLGRFYENGIGKDLARSNTPQPLRVHFALTEKWFTVFEANANHLGRLEELRSASIIKIYGLMKSMVEYFRINNLLLDQLELLEKHLAGVCDDYAAREKQHHLIQQMTSLATMLKELEHSLKEEVKVFDSLRQNAS